LKDHVHILIGYHITQPIPDLLRDIKADTSKFINDKKWIPGHFQWQDGYGAFSYSQSQIDSVIKYINNQEEHHRKKSFKEEYLNLLEKFDIEYNEKYLFEWYE
jgi:REP element-mobilizing transposase RayT